MLACPDMTFMVGWALKIKYVAAIHTCALSLLAQCLWVIVYKECLLISMEQLFLVALFFFFEKKKWLSETFQRLELMLSGK